MKVLIIAQYYPPDMGGGATRASNIAKGLSLAGVEVTVVTAFPHYPTGIIPKKYKSKILRAEKEGKIKVVRTYVPGLPSKGFGNRLILFLSFAVSSLFAMPLVKQTDAIWAANPNIIAVFPSLIYKLKSKCPIFQNVDDLWPDTLYDLGVNKNSLVARLGEFLAKVSYKFSEGVTPLSPGYVDILTKKYGVDNSKITIIPAGVDTDNFYMQKKQKNTDCFKVLYIGSFSPAYDFNQVFMAAKSLPVTSNVKFIIQGGGELAAELRHQVKAYGLSNVEIIEKIVARNEVAKIMVDVDALILPLNGIGSIELGISSKLYEYQAAGKPILCCSNGQPGRYVSQTKSGIVIKPKDFEGLSKSIIYLKDNPLLAASFGCNGRSYVTANLSIQRIGLAMKKVINSATVG